MWTEPIVEDRMYESNLTADELTQEQGIMLNGRKFGWSKSVCIDGCSVSEDEIVLIPWELDISDVTEYDVLILSEKELTEKLQSSDTPVSIWR